MLVNVTELPFRDQSLPWHKVSCGKTDQGNVCCLHTQYCHTYLSDNDYMWPEKCEGNQCDQTNVPEASEAFESLIPGQFWGVRVRAWSLNQTLVL